MSLTEIKIDSTNYFEKAVKKISKNKSDQKSFFILTVDKDNTVKTQYYGNHLDIAALLEFYKNAILADHCDHLFISDDEEFPDG